MANARNYTRYNSTYSTIDAYVINTGKQYKTNHSFGPFANSHNVIQYVTSGKGTFICQNQTYALEAGDLFLLPKNTPTQYYADTEDPYEYYWIAFDGIYANRLLYLCNLTPNNPVIHVDNKKVRKCFSAMYKLFEPSGNKRSKNVKSLSLFYEIFTELIDSANIDVETIDDEIPILHKMIEYIDLNYAKNITVTSICAKFKVDRSHFYATFQKQKNLTPKEYIEMLRMTEAAKLLETTNFPAYAIANAIGLPQNEFIKHFKKAFSCTPTEYRKQKEKPKIVDNFKSEND